VGSSSVRRLVDVPLEFIGKVPRTRSVSEAGHVKGSATTRHCKVSTVGDSRLWASMRAQAPFRSLMGDE
jgi:hypothetical protein